VFPVLIDTADIAVAEAGAIGGVVTVDDDLMSVIPVQPVAGTDPDKTLAVLEDGFDGTVGEALLAGEVCKVKIWYLRPDGPRGKQYN